MEALFHILKYFHTKLNILINIQFFVRNILKCSRKIQILGMMVYLNLTNFEKSFFDIYHDLHLRNKIVLSDPYIISM